MTKILLTNLFHIFKETDNSQTPNLTEEYIYRLSEVFFKNPSINRVPVFTGATSNNGINGFVPDFTEDGLKEKSPGKYRYKSVNYYKNPKEGCLTIVADGKAGFIFFRDSESCPVFTMNISSMALFKKPDTLIKKKFPNYDGMLLEWFYIKFFDYFQNLVSSNGVSHFTKEIYEKIELEIPGMREQVEEYKIHRYIFQKRKSLENLTHNLEKFKEYQIYSDLPSKRDLFFNIFNFEKGTHGFTEYAIYHNLPHPDEVGVPFWGGDIDHTIPKRFVSPQAKNIDGQLVKYFKEKECIILTVDGASAGSMTYKNNVFFTLNHHAGVLTVKPQYKERFCLEWFRYKYAKILKSIPVSTGSKTLSNTMLADLEIDFYPNYDDQILELKYYKKIDEACRKTELITKKVTGLISKELITESKIKEFSL